MQSRRQIKTPRSQNYFINHMEMKELKTKTTADLHKLLAQSREKLRELRFKDSNRQLKNIREIRQTRETVAQILTVLNTKA